MRNLHMSEVEISQKQQIDSNDQKPDGKSVTESLTGILKEDNLDARMSWGQTHGNWTHPEKGGIPPLFRCSGNSVAE